MIRCFDFLFSLVGLIFLFPLLVLIFFIGLFENGSPLFIQKRVGYNFKSFSLIKFRTMPMGTRSAGTHLVKDIKEDFSTFYIGVSDNGVINGIPVLKKDVSIIIESIQMALH